MSEPVIVYKCVICGKAWTKVQSLRAHMKAHKDHNFARTSIWVDRDIWADFKGLCEKHNTTTCHLMGVLLKAALKGDNTGMIDIGSPNPLVVNIHEYFLSGPRSRYKVPVDPSRIHHGVQPVHCPACGSKKVGVRRTSDGFVEGRCGCGAEWLILPPQKTGIA